METIWDNFGKDEEIFELTGLACENI